MNRATLQCSLLSICIVVLAADASAQIKAPAGKQGSTKAVTQAGRPAGRTQIVFLGTGYPRPMPDRMGPAVAIIANGTAYLVDAGTGIVRRAAQTRLKALEAANLRFVFVTHLHSDHTIGLPDLITTPWIMGRDVPLELYGPPGISSMARHLREAYKEDNNIRIKGLERQPEEGSHVNAYDVKPGFVYSDSNVKITTFAVKHGSWKNAYGYRFETPDRTIVVSGDAAPSESVVEACNGCDVLIHEAYTQHGYAKSDSAWKEYIASFHTSTKELAQLATRAKPKTLILYHQMYFGGPTDTEAVLLREMRAGFKGRTVAAHDLDVF